MLLITKNQQGVAQYYSEYYELIELNFEVNSDSLQWM